MSDGGMLVFILERMDASLMVLRRGLYLSLGDLMYTFNRKQSHHAGSYPPSTHASVLPPAVISSSPNTKMHIGAREWPDEVIRELKVSLNASIEFYRASMSRFEAQVIDSFTHMDA